METAVAETSTQLQADLHEGRRGNLMDPWCMLCESRLAQMYIVLRSGVFVHQVHGICNASTALLLAVLYCSTAGV